MYSAGDQHGGGLLPTAQPGQENPTYDNSAPPVYEQGAAELPSDEKQQQQQPPQYAAPPGAESSQSATDEKQRLAQQYFPPPPPGPPPSQDQHQQSAPHPLQGNPVIVPQQQQATHQPIDTQQEQKNYSIPQYDPAHPTFAPPPTNPTNESSQPTTTAPVHGEPLGHGTDQTHGHGYGSGHGSGHGNNNDPGNVSTFVPPEEHKKPGWSERFSQLGIKAAAPINSLAHKFGSQSFLPETIDKECDKAASILKSFCKNGVYADPDSSQVPTSTDPKAEATNDEIIDPTKEKPKKRVLVNIPPKVIAKAQGLAIFTTLRAGYAFSGATGSGILISRLPDGSWGPPSGIQVHSVGAGFMIGLDIYDCVCVINSREALNAFAKTRVALGSDLAVVAGPYGAGGAVEIGTGVDGKKPKEAKDEEAPPKPPRPTEDNQNLKPDEKKKNRRSLSASGFKPVFSYVKSRGFYAGIQVDGTVVVERKDANAAFYGERVSVEQIIRGEVPRQGPNSLWPAGARNLLETLKGAEVGSLKVKHSKDGVSPTNVTFGGPSSDPSAPVASGGVGADAAHPPGYVNDGVHRPEVGDVKYR
jgi:lipid-binding SYLF domain-containing protein